MGYDKMTWQDRVVEKARTFTMTNNPDGTISLTPSPGVVVQEGTPVNAGNMNHLEQGIWDAYWQSGAAPLEDGLDTVLVRESGLLVRVDESASGVLRRRTEFAWVGGALASVTTTIHAADGVTVARQWTDTLIRVDGVVDHIEKEVIA